MDIAPTADCDPHSGLYEKLTDGRHDNAFERVPIRFFNEGDVHYNQQGSRYYSEEVARQVLALMGHEGPVKR